jgi:predicted Holliday junction resolvase-like endonuclease
LEHLLLALLFASTLATGACLWLVWTEVRRLAGREQNLRREMEEQLRRQTNTLKENLTAETARQGHEAEARKLKLEAAVRDKLDELQKLVDGLRAIGSALAILVPSPGREPAAPASDAAATNTPVRKEARSGFGIISRESKP